MSEKSREEFQAFLEDIGHPRLDKRWRWNWSADLKRRAAPPLMNLEQMSHVVRRVSWVRWTLQAEKTGAGHVRAYLDVDFDEAAHIGLESVSFSRSAMRVYIACAISIFGSFFLIDLFPLLGLAVLAALVVVGFAVVARHTSVLSGHGNTRFGRAVNALRTWMALSVDELAPRKIPASWYSVREHPEVCDQIAEWFLARAEIDELTEEIDEGVALRKGLSPVDPRRATMQSEIRARRAKRDALQAIHDELADRITVEANAILSELDRQQREEEQRHREAAADERERERFRNTWNAITEAEQERVERQEAIDRWFDKNS